MAPWGDTAEEEGGGGQGLQSQTPEHGTDRLVLLRTTLSFARGRKKTERASERASEQAFTCVPGAAPGTDHGLDVEFYSKPVSWRSLHLLYR